MSRDHCGHGRRRRHATITAVLRASSPRIARTTACSGGASPVQTIAARPSEPVASAIGKDGGQDKRTRHSGTRQALSARGLARHARLAAQCRAQLGSRADIKPKACAMRWAWLCRAGVRAVSKRDNEGYEGFRVRPGPPKNRQQKFVSQVLKEVGKAGGKSPRTSGTRPGARLGRGHVAARFAGRSAQPGARRVTIKTRLVNLKQAGLRSPSCSCASLRSL